mmetsp:Transcript_33809/g.98310  ORF Transcript_33809/g.98310 Transcript_33809/m.98310 type:complete len:224 (-) Transcript_33809:1392-2063(-)
MSAGSAGATAAPIWPSAAMAALRTDTFASWRHCASKGTAGPAASPPIFSNAFATAQRTSSLGSDNCAARAGTANLAATVPICSRAWAAALRTASFGSGRQATSAGTAMDKGLVRSLSLESSEMVEIAEPRESAVKSAICARAAAAVRRRSGLSSFKQLAKAGTTVCACAPSKSEMRYLACGSGCVCARVAACGTKRRARSLVAHSSGVNCPMACSNSPWYIRR